MYEQIDIWRRVAPSRLCRYRCFRVLRNDTYCVQSADFIDAPIKAQDLTVADRQLYELFLEEAPDERFSAFPTIEEAIAAFDRYFEERN